MKGEAFYQTERVYFTETVVNPWSNQLEFLISWGSEGQWVRYSELESVIFWIDAV